MIIPYKGESCLSGSFCGVAEAFDNEHFSLEIDTLFPKAFCILHAHKPPRSVQLFQCSISICYCQVLLDRVREVLSF